MSKYVNSTSRLLDSGEPNSRGQGQLRVEHQSAISGGMQRKEELMRNEQRWGPP